MPDVGGIRLGILGLGSMGRHHVRNARATDGVDLVALADPGGDRFGVAGDLPVRRGVRELIDAGIDAAIVATPTALHEEAALALAEAGVHALIEKPLAASVEEGTRIRDAFAAASLVGAVGYVERCNPALIDMRARIASGQLGEIEQIVTRRQSPFPARISDVGNHLVNWLTPYKDRTTIVTGERGALVADTAMGDLTFYENGHAPLQWDAIAAFRGVSEGQVVRYALTKREPLALEHERFRDAITGAGGEHVTMDEALDNLRVIEAILASAASGRAIDMTGRP